MPVTKDLTGDVFGRLIVSGLSRKGKNTFWNCLCECGATAEVRSDHLKSGRSTSCGCYRSEIKTVHGKHGTRAYQSWNNMKNRCLNPNNAGYSHYGGRGISICKEWMEFLGFHKSMGDCPPGLSIERVNVDGNYEPSNCVWANDETQARNRRGNINSKNRAKGVYWNGDREKFSAAITIGEKTINLGRYVDFFDAISARKSAENKYWR